MQGSEAINKTLRRSSNSVNVSMDEQLNFQLDREEVGKMYTGDRSEMFGILELFHVYTEKFFKANIYKQGEPKGFLYTLERMCPFCVRDNE